MSAYEGRKNNEEAPQKERRKWENYPGLSDLRTLSLAELLDCYRGYCQDQGLKAYSRGLFRPLEVQGSSKGAIKLQVSVLESKTSYDVFFEEKDEFLLGRCSCRKWEDVHDCPHALCAYLAVWSVVAHANSFGRRYPGNGEVISQSRRNFEKAVGCRPENEAEIKETKLQSIILVAKEPRGILGNDTFENPSFAESIPSGHEVHISNFQGQFANPEFNSWDVPDIVTAGRFYRHQPLGSQLGSGFDLQYFFSDGVIISVVDILYDVYSYKVPQECLPGFGTQKSQRDRDFFRDYDRYLTKRQTEFTGCLLTILSQGLQKNLPVFLTFETEPKTDRRGMLLSKVLELKDSELAWIGNLERGETELHYGQLQITLKSEKAASMKFYHEFAVDPSAHTLLFHPIGRLVRPMKHSIAEMTLLSDAPPTLVARRHHQIQESVNVFRQFSNEAGAKLNLNLNTQVLTESEQKPLLHIDKDGRFTFGLRILDGAGSEWVVWNLPLRSEKWIRLLTGGFSSYLGCDAKDLAIKQKGRKRENDLYCLKHVGMASAAFLRAQLCTGKEASKKKASDLIEEIFQGLGTLCSSEFEVDLEHHCSAKAVRAIRRSLKEITNPAIDSNTVYLPHQEIILVNSDAFVRKLFATLLLHSLRGKEELLQKPRTAMLGKFFSASLAGFGCSMSEEGGIAPAKEVERYGLAEVNAGELVAALLPLEKEGFEIFFDGQKVESLEIQDFRTEIALREEETNEIDWFELHPKYFFKGVEILEEDARRLSEEGLLEFNGKLYRFPLEEIPKHEHLFRFWGQLQNGTKRKVRSFGESWYPIGRHGILDLLAMRKKGVPIVGGGKRWKEIEKFYDSLDKPRKLRVPNSVTATLKEYQKTGILWILDLYRLGLGGILADDMGLGKTVQVLVFLEILRSQKKLGRTLIIVPTSLTYNWKNEANRFTPELPVEIYQPGKEYDGKEFALVATYGQLISREDYFTAKPWDVVVFDEAQALKTLSTQRSKVARKLEGAFKLCLTGTPMENHFGEFFALMDTAIPGALGDYESFRSKLITAEKINTDDVSRLKLHIKPLLLRRTKNEILKELPPRLESTVKLPFEENQRRIYRDVAISWNERVQETIKLRGEAQSQLVMLTALLRMRQACSDPSALPEITYAETPPKVALLVDTLQSILDSGESALIFTQFLETFRRLEKCLQNFALYSIQGATSRAERMKILKNFNETRTPSILLMTLKTGGVGLNLTRASYVFHLEPWWNPAVENQASDRAHRIGQTKPVQVYRYIMNESVEEKIEILKSRKKERFDLLCGTEETETELSLPARPALSRSDFEYLLG